MKRLVAKNAALEITIKIGKDIETFFLYDASNYSEIVNAIEATQRKELAS